MTASALRSFRQISQRTEDTDRAVGFYRDVLGLELIARFGDLAFFDVDGIRLLLSAGSDAAGGPATSSVLYFTVHDIDAARATLEAAGVAFVDEPHLIFDDAAGTFGPAGQQEWMTFFRDSEGNLLALSARREGGPAIPA